MNYHSPDEKNTRFEKVYRIWVMVCLGIMASMQVIMIGLIFFMVYKMIPDKIAQIEQKFESVVAFYINDFAVDLKSFIGQLIASLVTILHNTPPPS